MSTSTENVIHIPPQKYIHVLDNNLNLTRLLIGPLIFVKQEHEQIIEGPSGMIQLGPRSYCRIQDPIVLGKDKNPVRCYFTEDAELDQIRIRQGQIEIRTSEDYPSPFPLYPGEKLVGKVEKQETVLQNTALRLKATLEFNDKGVMRKIGEQWQLEGPCTYVPKVEIDILKVVKAEVVKPNSALRVRAVRKTNDRNGQERHINEEWLIREQGAYLTGIDEEIVGHVEGFILTDRQCLHLRALKDFTDVYDLKRKSGSEWIVTNQMGQVHIKDIWEELVECQWAITLSARDYCVVMNPVQQGVNQWGRKVLMKGEKTFFLQPGEILENAIEQAKVLADDETILLKATAPFRDEENIFREAGQI